jgi:hypothetical protein
MAALPRRIIKETQRLMQEPVPGLTSYQSAIRISHAWNYF